MPIKCNMTEEERKTWWERFPQGLTREEEESAKGAFNRYIFYETWGRRDFREYFCWNCGRFEAERSSPGGFHFHPFSYKHGNVGECPNCGAHGQYVALGRYRSMQTLTEWRQIGFIREVDGALLLSAGNALRSYSFSNLDPEVDYWEKARYVIQPGKRQMWRRTADWDTGCRRVFLEPSKTFSEPFPRTHWCGNTLKRGEVYWIGADEIEHSDLRYCQAEDFMREFWGVNRVYATGELEPHRGLILYLGEYSRRPQLEMLYKLGHGDVINALIEDGSLNASVVDWRARTPAAFFRMSRADYKCFAEHRGKYRDLLEYRRRTEDAGGMSFAEYFSICAWLPGTAGVFFGEAKRRGVPAVKLWRYLQAQAAIGDTGDAAFRLWQDYLAMAERLERNLTFRRNLLPEDLPREHDAVMTLLDGIDEEELRNIEPDKAYGKRFRKLKRMYAYTDGELQIVIPVNGEDIEREGKRLRHCVGGYAPRHIQGKTTILFLRWADRPMHRYVTIEINDATKDIVQVHGYRNEADGMTPPRKRHQAFFDEWQDWLRRGSPRYKNGKPIRAQKQEAKTA